MDKTQNTMAIYDAGYLSPIKNKLGNAVGRRWRNLNVLAVYNGRPRNPQTEKQQLIRTRFAVAASLARALSRALWIGLLNVTKGTSVPPRSKFISMNWDFFHADSPGSGSVDYADLKIAEGALVEANFGSPSFSTPNSIVVNMTPNADGQDALASDLVYAVAYSPEDGTSVMASKTREDSQITIDCPDRWAGQRVHVYGFATREDGSITSMSRYLGSGTVN